tara:strand:- start:393 stop:620 length:228 start_codon:yes stop_codon:yes gene_type:complete
MSEVREKLSLKKPIAIEDLPDYIGRRFKMQRNGVKRIVTLNKTTRREVHFTSIETGGPGSLSKEKFLKLYSLIPE